MASVPSQVADKQMFYQISFEPVSVTEDNVALLAPGNKLVIVFDLRHDFEHLKTHPGKT